MAVAEQSVGVQMGKEFEVFRRSLLRDYYEEYLALPPEERQSYPPPSESALERAWELICRLNAERILPSAIVPSPEGGVGICFSRNGKYADLECFNTGTLLGAVSDRQGDRDVFTVKIPDEIEVSCAITRIGKFLGYSEDALPCSAKAAG